MPRDIYDQIGDKTKDVHGVLESTKDPSRAMSRAHQYVNEAAVLMPHAAPAAGTPEHQRYQLAQIKIDNARDEIRGYARRAMTEKVDGVYERIGNTESGVARRGVGIGLGRASDLRNRLADAERYRESSQTYVTTVINELDRVGLKQPDDDDLKRELDRRLTEAEKIIKRQKAEFGGAERARDIRKRSRLP